MRDAYYIGIDLFEARAAGDAERLALLKEELDERIAFLEAAEEAKAGPRELVQSELF